MNSDPIAESNLNDPLLTTVLVACMVNKLGGSVEITQADIDTVSYNTLIEDAKEGGSIIFTLVKRGVKQ